MCLDIKKHVLDSINKKFESSKTEYITCYKVLSYINYSPYRHTKWYTGWNKSDRRNKILNKNEKTGQYVDKGFHVFLTKRGAMRNTRLFDKVIKVHCYKKHLVAAGCFFAHHSAVFTKVFLPKEELEENSCV